MYTQISILKCQTLDMYVHILRGGDIAKTRPILVG